MISRITHVNYNAQTKNTPNFKSKIVHNCFLQGGINYAKENPTTEDSFFFFKSINNLLNDGKNRTLEVSKNGIQIKEGSKKKLVHSEGINAKSSGETCVKILNDFAENEKSFFKKTNSKVETIFNQIEDHKEAIENLEEDLAIEMKESFSEISKKLS